MEFFGHIISVKKDPVIVSDPYPITALSHLSTWNPVIFNLLFLTDEFWSGVIFQDTDPHTISWHIACMASKGNRVAEMACRALNALSPNHCANAIINEGPCP